MNLNIRDIKKHTIEKRLDTNYRYKMVGGLNDGISATDFDIPITYASEIYTDYSPPIGNMYVVSTSNDDDSAGLGCQSVRLIYIDSSGNQQTEDKDMDENNNVSIGTNVREIVDFYCLTFGATGYNVGIIYLKNDVDNKVACAIKQGFNKYSPIGIEVPQNGYTYLNKIMIISNERNNGNADIEWRIYLVENNAGSYVYRILLNGRCQYQKSIEVDLSKYQKISGSGNSSNNFAILPTMKTIQDSSFDTYGCCYLSGINSSST